MQCTQLHTYMDFRIQCTCMQLHIHVIIKIQCTYVMQCTQLHTYMDFRIQCMCMQLHISCGYYAMYRFFVNLDGSTLQLLANNARVRFKSTLKGLKVCWYKIMTAVPPVQMLIECALKKTAYGSVHNYITLNAVRKGSCNL